MKAVVVGDGEIGHSLVGVFSEKHDIYVTDPAKNLEAPEGDYDVLLIAVPFFDKFKQIVKDYQKLYKPKATIIFSTVPVGTSSSLGAVHVPVEGRHPDLRESIRITDKWMGGKNDLALRFLTEAGFKVNVLEKPEFTEFLKLRSTTVYGLNVEFARYSKEVADKIGLDFEKTKQWDQWVNDLYHHFNMNWATRYILDAPEGAKGGHCVTPNAKILNRQFPNELVGIVAEKDLVLAESKPEKDLGYYPELVSEA